MTTEHTTLPPIEAPPPRPARRLTATSAGLAIVGAALCALALFSEGDRLRLAYAWLGSFAFVWSIGLGSMFFLALHYLAHSVWSVVVKRVADMFTATLWLTPILFVPVVVFVLKPDWFNLFPWRDVHLDPTVHVRREYLNLPFFLGRAAVYFALWVGFARYFVSRSLRQDVTGNDAKASMTAKRQADSELHGDSETQGDRETLTALTLNLRSASAPFMLVFAGTLTFASVDWLMSLEPNWFSTMFGVYIFAGVTVTGLAILTLATIWLRATGRLQADLVRDEHLYSFGGLLFAFVCFWGYIGFSQYMLIWYANQPEESFYMVQRTSGGWLAVTVLLWVVRFGIPFLVLLSRRAKMNPPVLVGISLLLLFGQLVDLYWLIVPAYHTAGPVVGWQEAGPLLLSVGLLGLAVARFLGRHSLVATGDPMLGLSRKFHL